MRWKFWEKDKSGKLVKRTKPGELPSIVGKYLVVDLKYDPDWVWQLKAAKIEKENRKGFFLFRIFDPSLALMKGIKVQHYATLDDHPELIYFDGWYEKFSWQLQVNDRYKSMAKESVA